MSQALPERSNLDFLRKLAKDQLRARRATAPSAKLADAQLAVARRYGFPSWRKLHAHVEALVASAAVDAARTSAAYVDPFVTRLPERRKAHKIVQWKPLMDAAFAGDAERARRLLDAGADPNIVSTTPQRYRPLHRAIERKKTSVKTPGHEAVVKLLLSRDADPHRRGTLTQVTALQLAAMDGNAQFVHLLRKHFSALDVFHASVLAEDGRVARLLDADRSLAKARDENGLTALHYCAASGLYAIGRNESEALVRIATLLVERGADPNVTHLFNGEWPIPPLYYSAGLHNNAAMTRFLLDAGADPCDNESIYHASDEGHAECLTLFEHHVDAQKLAVECTRALATQLHWGHTRGAAWLLAHGADPNYLHPGYGDSALHAAASRGSSEKIVRMLLEYGADPNRKNAKGLSACIIAKRAEAGKVLALLDAATKATPQHARKRR